MTVPVPYGSTSDIRFLPLGAQKPHSPIQADKHFHFKINQRDTKLILKSSALSLTVSFGGWIFGVKYW